MSFDRTLTYLDRIDGARSEEEIVRELLAVTARFGFDHLLAGVVPTAKATASVFRKSILLSRWPMTWAARYLDRRYFEVDPVIRRLRASTRPFHWHECAPPDSRDPVLEEATEFGLSSGYAVPFMTLDGEIAALSFGGRNLDLSSEGASSLTIVSCFAIGRLMRLRKGEAGATDVHITARERECLNWAAAGKTEWETAMIMSISESTVEKHLLNARMKLQEAVAEAIRRKLIA